jgi:hypothetical protein
MSKKAKETVDPETEFTFEEALELLTLGEIGRIERHYGRRFGAEGDSELTPMEHMGGVIWAMERRKPDKEFDWPDVESMTMKRANGYFTQEPVEVDTEDPESDQGKDASPDAGAPASVPSSATS